MTKSKTLEDSNLPWIEKYRPNQLDDLISHNDILNTINRFLKEDRLPHLLFYGPPGTGKTTTILAIAKQTYKQQVFSSMVLELNASDDRGIGVVRDQILNFASTKTIFRSGFKLVILDEADAMTKDAQNALRRIIEKFTENVRFCLICNYLSKIIPAIQSRCTRFRFAPLSKTQMIPRLKYIIDCEKLKVEEKAVNALVDLAQGDMRRSINILQSASMAFDEVTETNVYICVGHPLPEDIEAILQWMLNEDIATATENINRMKSLKGFALSDIVEQIHQMIMKIDFSDPVRLILLDKLANLEYRISVGSNERIQLSSLVSAFSQVKENILKNNPPK